MANIDLVLENCKIVSAEGILEANIAVESGKISGIHKIGKTPNAEEKINCAGKIVLPGVIDPHVHFRDPGKTQKEDFYTGSLSAIFGGVTSVIDMPNNKPDIDSQANLELKRKEIRKKALVDYGLYVELNNRNFERAGEIKTDIFKVYIDEGMLSYENLQSALKKLQNKIISIHPEDFSILQKKKERPIEAEFAAIEKICAMDFGKNEVHFVHCTSAKTIELIKDRASFEVNIPYLFLSNENVKKKGAFAMAKPPLRTRAEIESLWKNLGKIKCLSTDHAPHTIREKESENPPTGVPGVETFLPLMVNAANENRLSWEELARLTSKGAAEIFGLKNKGEIKSGKDADLVILDRKKEWTIKAENLHSKCGWTPFENWKITGKVENVYLRGTPIIDSGELVGKAGFGAELK